MSSFFSLHHPALRGDSFRLGGAGMERGHSQRSWGTTHARVVSGVSLVIAGFVVGPKGPTGTPCSRRSIAAPQPSRTSGGSPPLAEDATSGSLERWCLGDSSATTLGIFIATDTLTAATAMAAWESGPCWCAGRNRAVPLVADCGPEHEVVDRPSCGPWEMDGKTREWHLFSRSCTVLIMLKQPRTKGDRWDAEYVKPFCARSALGCFRRVDHAPHGGSSGEEPGTGTVRGHVLLYSLGLATCFGAAGGALLVAGPSVFAWYLGTQFTQYATPRAASASPNYRGWSDIRRVPRDTRASPRTQGGRASGVLVRGESHFRGPSVPLGLTATAWAVALADAASVGVTWVLFRSALKSLDRSRTLRVQASPWMLGKSPTHSLRNEEDVTMMLICSSWGDRGNRGGVVHVMSRGQLPGTEGAMTNRSASTRTANGEQESPGEVATTTGESRGSPWSWPASCRSNVVLWKACDSRNAAITIVGTDKNVYEGRWPWRARKPRDLETILLRPLTPTRLLAWGQVWWLYRGLGKALRRVEPD